MVNEVNKIIIVITKTTRIVEQKKVSKIKTYEFESLRSEKLLWNMVQNSVKYPLKALEAKTESAQLLR